MHGYEKLNYIEFPASDMDATKRFFSDVFGWRFEDYGPDYSAFFNAGLDGGFYRSDLVSSSQKNGAALVVLYSQSLEETEARIISNGGVISTAIFSFPGGRRFHFLEPSGNEIAVWSDIGI
jgi:predicted enzyme related to lactoylglutathione lyase